MENSPQNCSAYQSIHLRRRVKVNQAKFGQQEAFEKCWAHSPLRAAALRCSNFTLQFTRCRYCRTSPAHRCPQQRQRQRVTEGTAMAP